MDGPGLIVTAGGVALALVLGGVANWQLRRPAHSRLWPAVPWLGVMFLAALALLVLGAHLISLLSGHPFGKNVG
jgi:hypothetical protein